MAVASPYVRGSPRTTGRDGPRSDDALPVLLLTNRCTRRQGGPGAARTGTRLDSLGAQARSDSLTLQSVYRSIEEGTPRIAAALATARAAEARIDPARRPPDPELQVGLMNRRLPGLGLDDVLGMNQIQLMQMIPIAGKLGLAARVERARTAAAGARAEDVRWEERARAAMAFYELYQTDQSIAVARETQRLLRDLVSTTSTMYAVGEGRQPDVLRAQVELARMTRTSYAWRRCAPVRRRSSTRCSTGRPSPPSPRRRCRRSPPSCPSRDSLERLALAHRPMLRAGGEDVRAAEAAERLARPRDLARPHARRTVRLARRWRAAPTTW